MEAASRPEFEPLADLPVEEPMGMGLPSGRSSTPAASAPAIAAAASKSSLADADEDLLSHGALLDLGADAPASSSVAVAPGPEARPDTSLVPTLSSASFEPTS